MAASGYEHSSKLRSDSQLMDAQLQRVIYTPWFKEELSRVLGHKADIHKVRLWAGPCGRYWLAPAPNNYMTTLAFEYDLKVFLLDQVTIHQPGGVIRPASS